MTAADQSDFISSLEHELDLDPSLFLPTALQAEDL